MLHKTLLVQCDQIDPPNHARNVKKAKVEKLAISIRKHGLLQSPGVNPVGDRFRLIFGHTRWLACVLIGTKEIEVRVYPPGTSEAEELAYSLVENHVRDPEDFDDVLTRVDRHIELHGGNFKSAAAAVGVAESTVSRARKIGKDLSEKAKEIAKENKVGMSVLYYVARIEKEKQVPLLNAYVDGTTNRAAIIQTASNKPSRFRKKKISLAHRHDNIEFKCIFPDDTTHEQFAAAVKDLAKRSSTHGKNGISCKLLPEVMNTEAQV